MLRIEIRCDDRIGMGREILKVMTENQFNVSSLEGYVESGYIYVVSQSMTLDDLYRIQYQFCSIPGIHGVNTVDLIPSERQYWNIETILASLPDPVLSVDPKGKLIAWNQAAETAFHKPSDELRIMYLSQLVDRDLNALLSKRISLTDQFEVIINKQYFLVDILPITTSQNSHHKVTAGAIVTLHSPHRIGSHIASQERLYEFDDIQGISRTMFTVTQQAKRMSELDAPLLILGETGTGKEVVARACHAHGRRRTAPFLVLNCANLSDHLAEQELFGYEATADRDSLQGGKPGLLELADGGTVFLDEIGEMSLYLQSKLLRFLEDQTLRRVGGQETIHTNIRIICSTRYNLEQLCEEGKFRDDLFYRINVLNLRLPPLRDRQEDIHALTKTFMERICHQSQRTPPHLSMEAQEALTHYPWPGNVRQLENIIFQALAMTNNSIINLEHLQLPPIPGVTAKELPGGSLENAMKSYEKQILEQLYPRFPSTRKLAQHLGISHTAVANKLKEHQIKLPTPEELSEA